MAIENGANSYLLWWLKGLALLKSNLREKAISSIYKVINIEPNFLQAYELLANILFKNALTDLDIRKSVYASMQSLRKYMESEKFSINNNNFI